MNTLDESSYMPFACLKHQINDNKHDHTLLVWRQIFHFRYYKEFSQSIWKGLVWTRTKEEGAGGMEGEEVIASGTNRWTQEIDEK